MVRLSKLARAGEAGRAVTVTTIGLYEAPDVLLSAGEIEDEGLPKHSPHTHLVVGPPEVQR